MKNKLLTLLAKRRKQFLINPRFQLVCIGYMTAISSISILVFHFSVSFFFWKFKKLGTDLKIPHDSAFFHFIQKQETIMHEIVLITAVILFILILIIGIWFSHRISGPIHRLESHMRAIASGKKHEDVKFRKNDYFPELAAAFNLVLDHFHRSSKR